MTSRAIQIFKSLPDALRKATHSSVPLNSVVQWSGVISGATADVSLNGKAAAVLDLSSTGAWASGNSRMVIVAIPGESNLPLSMATQSHAFGQFIQGSYSFNVYFETPASWTGAHAKFFRSAVEQLVGQEGAPIEIFLCANNTNPTVEGVNGVAGGAGAAMTSAGIDRPYALSYTGGI